MNQNKKLAKKVLKKAIKNLKPGQTSQEIQNNIFMEDNIAFFLNLVNIAGSLESDCEKYTNLVSSLKGDKTSSEGKLKNLLDTFKNNYNSVGVLSGIVENLNEENFNALSDYCIKRGKKTFYDLNENIKSLSLFKREFMTLNNRADELIYHVKEKVTLSEELYSEYSTLDISVSALHAKLVPYQNFATQSQIEFEYLKNELAFLNMENLGFLNKIEDQISKGKYALVFLQDKLEDLKLETINTEEAIVETIADDDKINEKKSEEESKEEFKEEFKEEKYDVKKPLKRWQLPDDSKTEIPENIKKFDNVEDTIGNKCTITYKNGHKTEKIEGVIGKNIAIAVLHNAEYYTCISPEILSQLEEKESKKFEEKKGFFASRKFGSQGIKVIFDKGFEIKLLGDCGNLRLFTNKLYEYEGKSFIIFDSLDNHAKLGTKLDNLKMQYLKLKSCTLSKDFDTDQNDEDLSNFTNDFEALSIHEELNEGSSVIGKFGVDYENTES